ncbi:hypothetical protein GCM10009000_116360 [Halobacterium noricense]
MVKSVELLEAVEAWVFGEVGSHGGVSVINICREMEAVEVWVWHTSDTVPSPTYPD